MSGWIAKAGRGRITGRIWTMTLALVLCLTPYFAATAVADAASPPEIVVNGEVLETSVTPILVENRLMVSAADFAHLVGGSVHLHQGTGVMRFISPVAGFILQAGDKTVYGHEEVSEQLVAPVIRDGSMMVSVRLLADAFDWDLAWDAERGAVLLNYDPPELPTPPRVHEPQQEEDSFSKIGYTPSEEEMDLFIRTVSAEAPGETLEGQIAVAAVIINRVLSDHFPDTLWEVLTAPNQFCVIRNGQVERPVVDGVEEAVQRALKGEDPSKGAYFFFAPDRVSPNSSSGSFMYSLPETVRIGVHSFRGMR
ncbi:MAG: cell wall hydrolase [Bacillota bacterium]